MTEISEAGETREQWEIRHRHATRAHDEHFQFRQNANTLTVDSSHNAIKAALIINGGAAIAILAFIASTISGDNPPKISSAQVIFSLILFTWGVAFAAFSSGFAYITNYLYMWNASEQILVWEHPYIIRTKLSNILKWIGITFHVTALSLVIISYVLFCIGCYSVADFIRPALER